MKNAAGISDIVDTGVKTEGTSRREVCTLQCMQKLRLW